MHKSIYLKGELNVPGDKSISHRAIMIGAIAKGDTKIIGFLNGADCLSSISCFKNLGIDITNDGKEVIVHGKGLHGLSKPTCILDTGNSGTTARLMSGILAAQDFESHITGDASIRKRPMKRIIDPLSMMGAHIESIEHNDCAPLIISGNHLTGIDYISPVASAQVKSAILLAGLYADGMTSVNEPYVSRNHTELMLNMYGGHVTCNETTATLTPVENLYGINMDIPGDISSAAYFIVAGLITPNSEITIKHVGLNKTRDGIIDVCKSMGGHIKIENIMGYDGEMYGDITVASSSLNGTTISGNIIPKLIDEIPIIAIMACFANGTTIIKDAAELKVKESNRIDTMVNNLKAMGADIEATDDGMIIKGGKQLHGASIDSKADHRIAMSFAIANLNIDDNIEVNDTSCVNISYPNFYDDLKALINTEL